MRIIILTYLPILIGILLIVLGFIGWKKHKIFLIVDKNKINIKKEDVKGCTESLGKTNNMFGIAIFIIMTIRLTDNDIYNFTTFILAVFIMSIGTVKNIKTQMKYKIGRWSK